MINTEKAPLSLFRWLALAALADWLITRTVTRAAIHIPKLPAMITTYQAINLVGQIAAAFVALLSLLMLGWIGWQQWQTRRSFLLPAALLVHISLSLAFVVVIPALWLTLLYHGLTLTIIGLFAVAWWTERGAKGSEAVPRWGAALLLPALVLATGVVYQMLPVWYAALKWPGPSPVTGLLYNAGELLIIISVVVLWWVYGRAAPWPIWLLGAIPALLFVLSFWRDPAMTGILAIWSTGLSLFLPWPLYALALWLATIVVLDSWQRQPAVAFAVLLLAAAGYAPQLSSQLFSALIALWLLSQSNEKIVETPRAMAPV